MAKKKTKQRVRDDHEDVIEFHLQSGRKGGITSYSLAVQIIMNSMKIPAIKRLLKDLFKDKVEVPSKIPLIRLITARLVEDELRYRLTNDGLSLLPYGPPDYKAAMEVANQKLEEYVKLNNYIKEKKGKKSKSDIDIEEQEG